MNEISTGCYRVLWVIFCDLIYVRDGVTYSEMLMSCRYTPSVIRFSMFDIVNFTIANLSRQLLQNYQH